MHFTQIEDDANKFSFGWNVIEFKSTNCMEEGADFKLNLLVNLGPVCMIKSPQRDAGFKMVPVDINVWGKGTTTSLESLFVWLTTPDGTETLLGQKHSEAEPDSIMVTYTPMEEGRYVLHGRAKNTIEAQECYQAFYVDTTPPIPIFTLPSDTDTTNLPIYSSRVDSGFYIVFKVTDNLDSLIGRPLNEEVNISFEDLSGNVYQTTTFGDIYYGLASRRFYRFPNGLSSGRYRLILSCIDKAGNEGFDTLNIIIDNEPPQITMLSPFDALFTSNQDFLELQYLTDEDAEITIKWINTITGDTITRKTGRAYYDMDDNGEPDTNMYFEGPTVYGEYLPDGIYTVQFIPKDAAGNKDTITTGVIAGDTLRVDRTKPVLTEVAVVPFITRDTTTFEFKVSEGNDISENRGSVEIRIYKDDSLDTTFTVMPGSTDTFISRKVNISYLNNGVHHIRVEAEDNWGNVSIASRAVVKGTIGTEITSPLAGSTLPHSVIPIRGIANDPDMFNEVPYNGYAIYWRHSGGSRDTTNIFVPEYLRNPGTPPNKGDESVENEALLGYWDADSLPDSTYDLLLESYEEGGLTLSDTITVSISSSLFVSLPSIDNLTLNILPLPSQDDTFNPTQNETLEINYALSGKPSYVSIDVVNSAGGNVYHQEIDNVMSEGIPSDTFSGVNIYRDNGKWWVLCYSPSFSTFNITIEGLDTTLEVTDTNGKGYKECVI